MPLEQYIKILNRVEDSSHLVLTNCHVKHKTYVGQQFILLIYKARTE